MIRILEKKDCCGCTACFSVCPLQCIQLKTDSEGFMYPEVDVKKCVKCGKCLSVCPVINSNNILSCLEKNSDKHSITKKSLEIVKQDVYSYAVFNNDDRIRRNSTSGGFFSALSYYIIKNGGIVYGVSFDSKFQVIHKKAQNIKEIASFRGSKYVQSNQVGIYNDIKKELDSNRLVLYSGTPCQVEGLKSFLSKDYDNLVTVDLFCHGVGSPKYWQKYIEQMEKDYNSPICRICFREKTFGYNSACMSVYFSNGKYSRKDHDNDLYWTAFSKFYIFRPSCYDCKFKTVNHNSDFTIGDYWGIKQLGEKYNKADGCTLLLVQSEKGKKLLNDIRNCLTMKKVDLFDALMINGGHMPSKLISSSPLPQNREAFFDDIDRLSVRELIKKYLPISIKKKTKMIVKPFLYRTKIMGLLKRS